MFQQTSLYIHIPFCVSKCDYCDFFSIACGHTPIPDNYIQALCNQINEKAFKYDIKKWDTVYIGGGTPSLLTPEQLKTLFNSIYKMGTKDIKELTIEANPDDITLELLNEYKKIGITRISCGIQALTQNVLTNVKRRSSVEKIHQVLNLIEENWNKDFSVDIICGLPEQSEDDFLAGLKELVKYKSITHISMYSLTIEENTPLGKAFEKGDLEYSFEQADELWIKGRNLLEEYGFYQYEVSNFCKEGKECKHNMVYWSLNDYIACGAGGTGTIYNKKSIRITNKESVKEYIDYWLQEKNTRELKKEPVLIEEIDIKTQQFEYFMMGLRTIIGICQEDFIERFKEDFPDNVQKTFEKWSQKKLTNIYQKEQKHYFALNKQGLLFLNQFLEEIL